MTDNMPKVENRDIIMEQNIQIEMPDGVELLADHYYLRINPRRSTLLVRSPYGRGMPFGMMVGAPFARRGFQVLLQSCRGTFGSGGRFNPHFDDREDALATIAWIRKQPWFNGVLGTLGTSYLGFVQWAIAGEDVPEWKAMSATLSPQSFYEAAYTGGSFALDTCLAWAFSVASQEELKDGKPVPPPNVLAVLFAETDSKMKHRFFKPCKSYRAML